MVYLGKTFLYFSKIFKYYLIFKIHNKKRTLHYHSIPILKKLIKYINFEFFDFEEHYLFKKILNFSPLHRTFQTVSFPFSFSFSVFRPARFGVWRCVLGWGYYIRTPPTLSLNKSLPNIST